MVRADYGYDAPYALLLFAGFALLAVVLDALLWGDRCSKRPRREPRPGGTSMLPLMWALRSGVWSSDASNSIARGSDS